MNQPTESWAAHKERDLGEEKMFKWIILALALVSLTACVNVATEPLVPQPIPTLISHLAVEPTPKSYEGVVIAYSTFTNSFGGRPATKVYFDDGTVVELKGELHLQIGSQYKLDPAGIWRWEPRQQITLVPGK